MSGAAWGGAPLFGRRLGRSALCRVPPWAERPSSYFLRCRQKINKRFTFYGFFDFPFTLTVSRGSAFYGTGGVRAEPTYWGTSWTALVLEVGKSPTEVPPGRRLPGGTSVGDYRVHFVVEPKLVPQPGASRQRRQCGEQDQGVRDRPALSACATRPGHAVNMLLDERRSARHPGAAYRCNSTALRTTAGCSARASELSNLAPRLRPQPAAQSPGDARTCMSSCGTSLARS